jgi:dihydroorotase
MHGHTRRKFLTRTAVGPALICSFSGDLLRGQSRPARYDLLVRGGKVVDPSQGLSAERDIAITGRTITRVAANIPESEARQVLNARGMIVTPGLIDVHVHVYDGVAPLGIPADPNCIAKGVTTVLDAGSAGAHTFPGLRKYVINVVETRVLALLNILGVKIRLTRNIAGDHDLQALKLAREAADAVRLPLMVHIGGTASPLPAILAMLKKGDVITHSFRGSPGGILDDRGRILPEVRKAVEGGVHLDVGHGAGSFSFNTAEKAMAQELLPGTISSDVHQFNYNGPVFDLATTLSKFLHLGMTLEQVIERATANPARTFGFPKGLGTLREGSEADVAVFALQEGRFEFTDSLGAKRPGKLKLVPMATVKTGKIYGSASIPVVTAG